MFCYVIKLIYLNLILINSDSAKILCMVIRLKFKEPEAKIYIT